MFMMCSTVAHHIDSGNTVVYIDSGDTFRPYLMYSRNPKVTLVVSVGHVSPKTQSEVRYDIVRSSISTKPISQMVNRVTI